MVDQELLARLKSDPKLREQLWSLDYSEKPVDVEQFINDPQYIGKSTGNGSKIYPIWKETLKQLFSNDVKFECILTGSIGGGKSTCAVIGMAYLTYRTLCLRDPYNYYDIVAGKPLSFVFFSMSLALSGSTNFIAYQRMMQNSPWFKQRGIISGMVRPTIKFPLIDYKLSSPRAIGGAFIGGDVIGGMLDEINNPGEPITIKERTFRVYQSAIRRTESRFMDKGVIPGMKLFLCASKDDELSFIDQHIDRQKDSNNAIIVDKPIWEIKPAKYSGETFPVVLGDNFHEPKVITKEEVLEYLKLGHKIVDVPIEHKRAFDFDVVGSLRDIAGITTAGLRKRKLIPNVSFLNNCYDENMVAPFTKDELDFDLFTPEDITHFFMYSNVKIDRMVARFIHIDLGISHDSCGIACSYVNEYRDSMAQKIDGTMIATRLPVVRTEWILRINPKRGGQIPIAKIKKFIFDLKSIGFNIKTVTTDGYQSTDLQQTFTMAGINAKIVSVDKTPNAYINLRDLILDNRWFCYFNERLHFELSNLEVDPETGKINHPDVVKDYDNSLQELITFGTKDVSDAVAASVMTALEEMPNDVDLNVMQPIFNRIRNAGVRIETRQETMKRVFKLSTGEEVTQIHTGPNYRKMQEFFDRIHQQCANPRSRNEVEVKTEGKQWDSQHGGYFNALTRSKEGK